MARTAKRGISNAVAMAACAVCLVAAAAIVMVPVQVLAHRQAGQPVPFHSPESRVSIEAAWDAARVSDVALADLYSQRSPARTGHLADIGPTERLEAGFRLGVQVPADAPRDARANTAAGAARDDLVDVPSRPGPGQTTEVLGHSVAGPGRPFRRVAMPRMRIAHADRDAAAIPAEAAEWYGSVMSTQVAPLVGSFGQGLPVQPASRIQMTSLSDHDELRALNAGRLRSHADQLTAAACASEPDSARGPSPSPAKGTPEFSDQFRFHSRGLFTYCVSA
jgi:hypothetical protein